MSTPAPPPGGSTDPRNPPPPDRGLVTGGPVLAGICLAVQFIALLWVSTYARTSPTLFGFPFFYWYQLLWVVIGATLTVIAYLLVSGEERRRRAPREGSE